MKYSATQHFQIAFHLCLITVAIIIGVYVSHVSQNDVKESLTTRIDENVAYLLSLALITDRNGADETTEKIITDCPRRVEYESYLIRLASLSKQELVIMQNLFESCGAFYAERKALMVSRLEREYESFLENLMLLDYLDDVAVYETFKIKFSEIVTLERERSALLNDQKNIQKDIIQHLISGKSSQSTEVTQLVRDAQEISELLSVQDRRVDVLRAELSS